MENNQNFGIGDSDNGNHNLVTAFGSTNLTNQINVSNSYNQLSHANVNNFNSNHHYNHLHHHSSNTFTNSSISNNEQMKHEYNDHLDGMSNLIINNPHDSYDPDTALLDQYEYDMDSMLNENYLQNEKEQKTNVAELSENLKDQIKTLLQSIPL